MTTRHTIAIDFVRGRLRVLYASVYSSVRGSSVAIERAHVAVAPSQLELDDSEAVGAWIADQIDEAGISRARATYAIAREDVVLKRFSLPTTDVYELPGMVRLSMRKDLPFDPETAIIDYIVVHESDNRSTVLAVAVPESVISTVGAIAKAAGLKLDRIALRSMGTVSLLASLQKDAGESGGWLGVDITGDGVELVVIDDGSPTFSRAAEVAHADVHQEFANAVVTEARRSWMSYRIVEDQQAISRGIVMGVPEVTRLAAPAIGEALSINTSVLSEHPLVTDDGHALATTWPLAGLLLEPITGRAMLDFQSPRRAPDRYARRRQMGLAAAGLALILIVAGIMFSMVSIQNLERELEQVREQYNELRPIGHRADREWVRLFHLQKWNETSVDWLEHLEFLHNRLADARNVVLDNWSGSLRFRSVEYDGRASDPQDRWTAPHEILVTINGEAQSRREADAFREALVDDEFYTATPTGADTAGGDRLPFPFRLTLSTRDLSPRQSPDGDQQGDISAVAQSAINDSRAETPE